MAAVISADVKLVGLWASPFVIRARLALEISGVGYEFLEETFGKKSELLLKSNPVYKKMPVLIHGGKTICESMIIVQYIDEVWNNSTKPSILPLDPYERALARFWAVFIDDKWTPSLFGIIRARTEEATREAVEGAAAALQILEEGYTKHYDGKAFFGGESVGYVDIALGSSLRWIAVVEEVCNVKLLDETKTPRLLKWAERFLVDDAVKAVIPETDKFVEFSRVVKATLEAAEAAK
ncbi:glutathione S-transferase U17-like isoform X2 [Iris pallida]|uniref:glutathione transferase n=1 Tax=Iris pallida TaxID=29817 RepID=A0AAX6HQM4_IRIPA|nr:glutathione S-transferase U17-like isoform X2 [Iris pallida]